MAVATYEMAQRWPRMGEQNLYAPPVRDGASFNSFMIARFNLTLPTLPLNFQRGDDGMFFKGWIDSLVKQHTAEIDSLVEDGQFNPGYENVAAHGLTAGVANYILGALYGVVDLDQLVTAGFSHDSHKLRDKFKRSAGGVIRYNGTIQIKDDPVAHVRDEMGKSRETPLEGITAVTGCCYNGFELYTPQQGIMRFVDSLLGEDERSRVRLDWRRRIAGLREKKPEIDQMGRAFHNGRKAFDVLEEATSYWEDKIYSQIISRFPELRTYFKDSSSLGALVGDIMFYGMQDYITYDNLY